jgi:hypothetical protein
MPQREFPGAGGKPKASEILQASRERERDCRDRARGKAEYAQILYMQIKNTGWLPGGVDKLIAARRMRKPLLKAAEAALIDATMEHTFRSNWLKTFGDPGAARKQSVDFTS